MSLFDRLKLVLAIGARNLLARRAKNILIAALLFFGTFFVVLGSGLLESMEREMTKSITQSLAGHLHAYSAKAADPIALFGGGFAGQEDIGHIADFAPVKAAIASDENVRAVVPMSLDSAFVNCGNDLDRVLESFREASKAHDIAAMERHRGQIEEIARLLQLELDQKAELLGKKAEASAEAQDLARVRTPEFWAALAKDPEAELQFLDTKVAPLLEEGRTIPLRYVGTDLDAFKEHFDRLEIIEGKMVPKGHRGLLLNKRFADAILKHKVARDLDAIERRVREGAKIADDPLLKGQARKLSRLQRSILLQLDADEVVKLVPVLEAELPEHKGEPPAKLLQAFLTVDDATFARRYALFYEKIAPLIDLYDVRVGDTVAVRTFTKTGQLRSVNVRVYGMFTFKGLDKSDLAGAHNLMDLMSFRDLYELMTDARKKETDELRRKIADVDPKNADQALFGGEGELTVKEDGGRFDEFAGADMTSGRARRAKLENESYDQATIENGVVLDAAILLKDPSMQDETRARLAAKLKPLDVQVVGWQQASGMVGQVLILVRAVLLFAAAIIFFVAMVIINNSMLLATMERVAEIGTLLAIGASERFVMVMFLVETAALGLVAGGAGGLLALGALAVLAKRGIHASSSVLEFLFSGGDLFPSVSLSSFAFGLSVILAVSLLSALYPALVATRISPRAAMEAKE
jgi:ABC-type lipoprotein release transport system permease subunit